MTLMSQGFSSGEQHRCDARCYNAKGPDCDCICGGKNHGVGLQKAQENTAVIGKELIAKLEAQTGQKVHVAEQVAELFSGL